jgi:hypothetical protein
MLEKQRQQYLSVLGVESYVPRRILPGAAPSILIEQNLLQPVIGEATNDEAVKESIATISSEDSSTDFKGSPHSSPLDILSKAPVADEKQPEAIDKEETEEVSTQASNDSVPSSQSISFVLNIWQINESCLVVDTREPGAALPTDRLLQNILRVIGYPLVQLPQSDIVRWPLFKSQSINANSEANSADQACAMVQAYITAKASKLSVQHILLMGEAATAYSLGTNNEFNDLQGTLVTESSWEGAKIAVTPSLVTMLQEPLQKRIAWKALKSLLAS